ncbi:MAG: protein kinase domain-containing protein [Rhodoglobus sp.]
MNDQDRTTIGGYRVVRKLGDGPRAEIFLGYPVREESEEPPAALKVYRARIEQSAILREIEALNRASGAHVVAVRDVALGTSRALVLDRLARGGLARLLHERDGLQLGESITILAPLLEAISRMHLAGCVHGAIGAERVLFTTDGAPVIVGFGSASLLEPGLPPALLAEHEGVAGDLQAMASLAGSVLARVNDARAAQLADWAADLAPRKVDGWCAQFTARLFDLGDAAPIEFDIDPSAVPASVGRLVAPLAGDRQRERKAHTAGLALAIPEWLDPVAQRVAEVLGSRTRRLRSALRVVRPAVWGVAATVAVGLTAAVAFVPSGPSDATTGAPTVTATTTPTAPVEASAVTGDDPIAAAVVLLDARSRCFTELSVICLDDVDQQGSGALSSDQSAMRDAQNGAEVLPPFLASANELELVEQVGDAVLLEWATPAENEPASLLLMKGEAGWRIRDYLSQ